MQEAEREREKAEELRRQVVRTNLLLRYIVSP